METEYNYKQKYFHKHRHRLICIICALNVDPPIFLCTNNTMMMAMCMNQIQEDCLYYSYARCQK